MECGDPALAFKCTFCRRLLSSRGSNYPAKFEYGQKICLEYRQTYKVKTVSKLALSKYHVATPDR